MEKTKDGTTILGKMARPAGYDANVKRMEEEKEFTDGDGNSAKFVCSGAIMVVDKPGWAVRAHQYGEGTITDTPGQNNVRVFKTAGGIYYFWRQEFLSALGMGNIGFNRQNPKSWEKFKCVGGTPEKGDKFKIICCRDDKPIYVRADKRLKHDDSSHAGTLFQFKVEK